MRKEVIIERSSGAVTAYLVFYEQKAAIELVRLPFNESGLHMPASAGEAAWILKRIIGYGFGEFECGRVPDVFEIIPLSDILLGK